MKWLLVRAMFGGALVCALLGGIAMGHATPAASLPAHARLACAGAPWLPPCE